ncbi:hypothetical protein BH11PSE8_BH11PSE8_18210 [soil metagenome]
MPSAAGRHSIELLADEAGLDLVVTHWPLPRAAVARAVDALPATLSPALAAARDLVQRELKKQQGAQFTLGVRNRGDTLIGFGDDATRGSSVAVRTSVVGGAWVAAQIGARIDVTGAIGGGSKFRLDDAALVTEALGIQAQAWSHRSWWGPGWQSSLLLGNNAPAFSGVGLQRASASRSESSWLSWLGPWTFEVFAAQTEDTVRPANPYIIGQRLTFEPFSNLEIGLTRTAQWGGRGRPQSVGSLLDLLIGKGVNADDANERKVDPANEMAGFDVRLRCPAGLPCAAYTQLIGEDEAGMFPSRFLGLYGVETWSADGRRRYFAEYTETGCRSPIGRPFLVGCAYRNYAYPEGYASAGRWMGASIGPDSRLLTVGWLDAAGGGALRLHVGRVGSRVGSFSPDTPDSTTSGRLIGFSARQRVDWAGVTVTPELAWQRIAAPAGTHTDLRIGATLQMNLDDVYDGASSRLGSGLSSANLSAWQPLLLSGGLVLGSALLDHPLDDFAKAHGHNPSAKALRGLGSGLPVLGMGLAGASWVMQRGSVQGDVAYAALSAGASALVVSEVGKYAIDRARPSAEAGARDFGSGARSQSSFPSIHSSVAWAVVTPYAKYYDAPWLYGLAALTSAGRVIGRDHWVSDTVAGAAIGYYLGDYYYRRSGAAADADASNLRLWITPRSVAMQMRFE